MKKGSPVMAMTAEDKKWQAEEDLRTLTRAEEVRKDPKRMKACSALAKERIKEMQSLMGEGKK